MVETFISFFQQLEPRLLAGVFIEPALVAVLFVSAGLLVKRTRWKWLFAAIFTVFLYNISISRFFNLVEIPAALQTLTTTAGVWVTFGLLLLVTAVIGTVARAFSDETIGLTLRQTPGSLRQTMMVTAGISLLLTATAVFNVFQIEDRTATGAILYSATLQPFAEEVAFRGVLLLLLNEAFQKHRTVFGARVGWGLALEAIAFGVFHLVGWSDGHIQFNFLLFAWTFSGGLIFVWLRERSGSLFLPYFVHAYGNTLAFLI